MQGGELAARAAPLLRPAANGKVDVPSEVDIYRVYDALTKGESADVWDFEEAHVGHVLKAQAH